MIILSEEGRSLLEGHGYFKKKGQLANVKNALFTNPMFELAETKRKIQQTAAVQRSIAQEQRRVNPVAALFPDDEEPLMRRLRRIDRFR